MRRKLTHNHYQLFSHMRFIKSIIVILLLILSFPSKIEAQTEMTSKLLVELLLKNNYEIQVARDDSTIKDLAATRGNAGMLPQVGINAGATAQSSSINQRFSNGLEVNTSGVTGNGLNARAELGWTLFDGGKMFIMYNRLKSELNLSSLQLKSTIEAEVEKVLLIYFDIVRNQQELSARKVSLDLAEEQVKIIQAKIVLGSASRQELLQSNVDRNSAKSQLFSQQLLLDNLKLNLYRSIAVSQDSEYTYPQNVESTFSSNLDDIASKAQKSNTQLLVFQNNQVLQDYFRREIKSEMSPMLDLSASYGFNRTSSSAGFALFNQSIGLNGGLTLNWNLFNGSQVNSRIKQSNIRFHQSELYIKQQTELISAEVKIAYKQWLQSKQILELEAENLVAAEENLNLATERLRVGQIGILPVKESQRSFQEAISRKSTADYQMHQAEISLMKLAGELLK